MAWFSSVGRSTLPDNMVSKRKRRTPEMITMQNNAETHPVMAYKMILGSHTVKKEAK